MNRMNILVLRKIPGSYTLVAGFLICQYTVQYTSCILRETGGKLAGLWKVCTRILHLWQDSFYVSTHFSLYNNSSYSRILIGSRL